jgi:hypothetical protein
MRAVWRYGGGEGGGGQVLRARDRFGGRFDINRSDT